MKYIQNKKGLSLLLMMITTGGLYAQNYTGESTPITPPALIGIMGVLALVLLFVVIALLVAMANLPNLFKETPQNNKNNTSANSLIIFFLAGVLSLGSVYAQAPADSAAVASGGAIENIMKGNINVFDVSFWILFAVVLCEILVILGISILWLSRLFNTENRLAAEKGGVRLSWWERFNDSKSLQEEKNIQLDHVYDGIRELDNSLPPWWLYGFYVSILFSAIYIWRYHIVYTAPLSEEEYNIAVNEGEIAKSEYMKKSSGGSTKAIDENSVELLADASDISAGKSLYTVNCVTCHGSLGEGGVGPNFTDEYWIHGGSIKDVFKLIKYGAPEKGMVPWKDNFSPKQIAQIASFIKSLKGTNPPKAKEPQGDLYKEEATASAAPPSADSTKTGVDSPKK